VSNVTSLKPKNDYSHLIIIKMIDGEPVEYVNIDDMTEEQFKKYCADTGTEWFKRAMISV
jgi:hypothetical protein